ncbi:NUDIX hydrolase [Pelotalea chapellei]|uniref:NUDIX hydrolase n=1 Tax=Pelotalea chapellei TaxID=44671 RepID=A0ABS5U5W6_9BACT|nr:NUDIX hydrolase [Pelotalea chapellei]MBT1071056.1 NUDIX hydrolase [Pelotalea chapellei]
MSGTNPMHCVVVGGLIRNSEDKVLLIKHHKRGWEIPQGRLEEGETLIDALHREVLEEAGVEIEAGSLAAVWSMITPPSALVFTFLGTYKSGDLTPCEGDSTEACWASESDALEMVTGTVMRERLRALLDYDGTLMYRAYTIKPYQLQLEQNFCSI